MITFTLDGISKARIWLGEEEFPTWEFRALYQSEYRLDARRRKFPYGKRAAAVELLLSKDGEIEYGAIGATFNPRQTEWLTTYISSTHAHRRRSLRDACSTCSNECFKRQPPRSRKAPQSSSRKARQWLRAPLIPRAGW